MSITDEVFIEDWCGDIVEATVRDGEEQAMRAAWEEMKRAGLVEVTKERNLPLRCTDVYFTTMIPRVTFTPSPTDLNEDQPKFEANHGLSDQIVLHFLSVE